MLLKCLVTAVHQVTLLASDQTCALLYGGLAAVARPPAWHTSNLASAHILGAAICSATCMLCARFVAQVNFAARIAAAGGGTAAAGGAAVDLIDLFTSAAAGQPGLLEALAPDFGRGHRQATAGSVSPEAFQQLKVALGFPFADAASSGSKAAGGKRKGTQPGSTPLSPDGKKLKTLLSFPGFGSTTRPGPES